MFPANATLKQDETAALTTLENTSNQKEYENARTTLFAPEIDSTDHYGIIPLIYGYLAILVGFLVIAASARIFGRSMEVHLGRMLLAGTAVPLLWEAMVWGSWNFPMNWTPEGVPFVATGLGIYISVSLPAAIGLMSGLTGVRIGERIEENVTETGKLRIGFLSRLIGTKSDSGAIEPVLGTGKKDDAQTKVNLPDNLATRLLSDSPARDVERDDQLHMAPMVYALKNVLDNPATRAPLAISINGPWGSGKTSIMNMVETELKKTGRFDFVWFNAWQYRTENEILQGFLNAISEQLTSPRGFNFLLKSAMHRLLFEPVPQKFRIASVILLLSTAIFFALVSIKSGVTMKNVEEATVGAAGGGLGILGTVVLLYRWLQPFKMPWEFLVTLGGPSAELSPIDRFNRDFRHVRKALGNRKLLVFVDDLDRCAADEVMEVLKTVNMITNAPGGPGKTFFMLGFDWQYVLKAVDEHFRQLRNEDNSENGDNDNSMKDREQFGRDYLKKIITLSLSLPEPAEERLKQLTDHKRRTTATSDKDTIADPGWFVRTIHKVNHWIADHSSGIMDILLFLVFLAFLALVWPWVPEIPITQNDRQASSTTSIANARSNQGDIRDPGSPGSPAVPGSQGTTGYSPGSPGNLPSFIPVARERAAQPTPTAYWPVAAILAASFILFLLLYGENRGFIRPGGESPPTDPEGMDQAISKMAAHMPKNPRDIVRLINLTRMTHLVQAPENKKHDILPGRTFSAAESVCLALWFYKHAHRIDVGKIEKLITTHPDMGFIAKLIYAKPDDPWAEELYEVSKNHPELADTLETDDQIRRFLEIYRNLLQGA